MFFQAHLCKLIQNYQVPNVLCGIIGYLRCYRVSSRALTKPNQEQIVHQIRRANQQQACLNYWTIIRKKIEGNSGNCELDRIWLTKLCSYKCFETACIVYYDCNELYAMVSLHYSIETLPWMWPEPEVWGVFISAWASTQMTQVSGRAFIILNNSK